MTYRSLLVFLDQGAQRAARSRAAIRLALALCGPFSALALVANAQAESRGELLYATHCIACHTTQMHWRDQKVATDWSRLKSEVRRWQRTAALDWSEADIVEVARYLNDSIYRFAQTPEPSASLGPQPGRKGSDEWSFLTVRQARCRPLPQAL